VGSTFGERRNKVRMERVTIGKRRNFMATILAQFRN
jgi:hypothetical protein